jgi:hypothetical protein
MGEVEMKNCFAKSTLVLTAFAVFAPTMSAKSNDWAEPLKLCAANPNCKQQLPNPSGTGAAHFVIRQANSVISIRCEENRDCRRVYPRGASSIIGNLTDIFSAD